MHLVQKQKIIYFQVNAHSWLEKSSFFDIRHRPNSVRFFKPAKLGYQCVMSGGKNKRRETSFLERTLVYLKFLGAGWTNPVEPCGIRRNLFFACLKGLAAGAAGVRMPGRRRKIHHFHNPDCSRRPYFLPVSFVFVLSLLLPGGLQCFCELKVLLVVFPPAFWMINDACESMKSSVSMYSIDICTIFPCLSRCRLLTSGAPGRANFRPCEAKFLDVFVSGILVELLCPPSSPAWQLPTLQWGACCQLPEWSPLPGLHLNDPVNVMVRLFGL